MRLRAESELALSLGLLSVLGCTTEGLEPGFCPALRGTWLCRSLGTLDSSPAGLDSLLGFTPGEKGWASLRENPRARQMLEECKGGEPKAWLTTTAPHRQVWASGHSTELNLFCPLPPPCPIVQSHRKLSCLPLLSACPPCPSGSLAISHRAGWTLRPGCASVDGRRQGAPTPTREPLGVLCSPHLPCPLSLFPSSPVPSLVHISLFPCIHLTSTVYYVLSSVSL